MWPADRRVAGHLVAGRPHPRGAAKMGNKVRKTEPSVHKDVKQTYTPGRLMASDGERHTQPNRTSGWSLSKALSILVRREVAVSSG